MHHHSLDTWRHEHVFLGARHDDHERRTWLVVGLTAAMMAIEIVGGLVFGSMALLADGWHMSTHAGALAIAALAYRYARTHARDPRFAFGTGKLGDLAGFTSAIVLAFIAALIGYESAMRLLEPVAIRFDEAIAIAVVGLGVNLLSAWLLGHPDSHGHGHGHHADHGHDEHHHIGHHDHNARAAYWHVLADALTSVLAIVGLLAGRLYGWTWLDPVVGVAGSLVIAHWSWRLARDAGAVLLDAAPDPGLGTAIRGRIEVGGDRITDLHIWRIGPGHHAAIIAVVSDTPMPASAYKDRLGEVTGLSHVTVEVHRCSA
ncbi:CDF family Co(II)/Ni(II) efflux transporter DmeF [Vineibacter terrae]|uniref:CDF family Co(II)/Ni(II) efflux transporter DmeF n=1 Tax=Vineibacter terrae TaxID=2586908 RepID=A0A5C8P914_9HYPH|nr:CDF family Co(II)/Ni(II) efflux transporter DmeF [Vineibacter terrae]TXL69996.1 CDF family Co(II)/Ni(II) efflux transporter DmeF [Vineibacter terrae]